MKSKATVNYWVDVVIGLAFIVSAASGIVLLFAPSGGYQGGRNPHYARSLLLGRATWNDLHTWSSVVMIAGVLGHLILHWSWMTCMTSRLLKRSRRNGKSPTADCPNPMVP